MQSVTLKVLQKIEKTRVMKAMLREGLIAECDYDAAQAAVLSSNSENEVSMLA
jgi:hypothetical protein